MSNPMEDDRDLTEPQARQEYEQWLDEREKEMVDNLDYNMKQMWKQFEHIFQAHEPKHDQGE